MPRSIAHSKGLARMFSSLWCVNVANFPDAGIYVGARGFEPPTSWSQTTRSTKLSYAPNMQPIVYHGFCSRASGERTRLACCDWRPRQSLVFLLPQIRCEPFFHCGYGFVSPGRIINCLIACNLSDP